MASALSTVDVDLPPLRSAVDERFPAVAAALDPAQATTRVRAWATATGPEITSVRPASVLLRPDGGCTLRYLVRLVPEVDERILLVEVSPSGDTVVRPFPDDSGLPTLARALDPGVMRPLLGQVLPGTGGERAVARCAVDVVRYPRAGRCVLRYRLSAGPGGPGELRHPVVFGKVYADDGGAPMAASALRLLRRELAALEAPVVVPRPLAVVAPLRLVLTEPLAGRPQLPDLLRASAAAEAPLSAAVRTAARTAAALHACPPSGAALPVRSAAGERLTTEHELASLESVWPEAAARLRRGAARAIDATEDLEPPPVLAHGDLTPGQLLLDGSGGAGLVDVDTLCLAEPALDLGRFLAYLSVAGVRRSTPQPLMADLTALFVNAYGEAGRAAVTQHLLRRIAAYRDLTLARIGASACRQLKDDRLRAVVAVQDEGDDWMRSVAG